MIVWGRWLHPLQWTARHRLRVAALRPETPATVSIELAGRRLDRFPAEAGQWLIDASVSFSKGCYTGQELVARIDSRGGNTPTKLVGVRGPVTVGDAVVIDGNEVGRVTSAAGDVGLAFVRREVEPPVGNVVPLPMQ